MGSEEPPETYMSQQCCLRGPRVCEDFPYPKQGTWPRHLIPLVDPCVRPPRKVPEMCKPKGPPVPPVHSVVDFTGYDDGGCMFRMETIMRDKLEVRKPKSGGGGQASAAPCPPPCTPCCCQPCVPNCWGLYSCSPCPPARIPRGEVGTAPGPPCYPYGPCAPPCTQGGPGPGGPPCNPLMIPPQGSCAYKLTCPPLISPIIYGPNPPFRQC